MKQKKNETIPVGLLIGLLLLCTVVAGGIALLARGEVFQSIKEKLPQLSRSVEEPAALQEGEGTDAPAEEAVYVDEELHKIANTYGEIFGLLVTEGKASLASDKYSANDLYQVDYSFGQVQVDMETQKLYWFERTNVKANTLQLTERELLSKAKEYFAILQLDKEYGNIARRVDREQNIATVIFQRVIDEDRELYSDYEAVKMILSAQTGELMSCKIFNLPLVEQEGKMMGAQQIIAAVQDELSVTFEEEAETQLSIGSPIAWGDSENYTSRILWKVTADGSLYYVDPYSGDVLGSIELP